VEEARVKNAARRREERGEGDGGDDRQQQQQQQQRQADKADREQRGQPRGDAWTAPPKESNRKQPSAAAAKAVFAAAVAADSKTPSPSRSPYKRPSLSPPPGPSSEPKAPSPLKAPSPQDDISRLHASLQDRGEEETGEDSDAVAELHRTVERIFVDEENLLNLHMSIIQENAELLTKEGKLLQAVQGNEDYNIDDYASRLEGILERKTELITQLGEKLGRFRESLRREEELSRKVGRLEEV